MSGKGEGTEEKEKQRSNSIDETNVFIKSRRTERSPVRKRKEMENSDEQIMVFLREMNKNIETARQETKNEILQLSNKLEGIIKLQKEEINELKQNETKMEKKVQNLENRIEELEKAEEKREKLKKRNNIIIKGANLENNNEEIENFLLNKLGVEIKVTNTYKVGRNEDRQHTVATINTWENKMNIMKNKNKLIGTKIYIDNDLTREDMRIQKEILKRAKEEKEKNSNIKIGYRKLKIENEWYVWCADTSSLKKDYVSKND